MKRLHIRPRYLSTNRPGMFVSEAYSQCIAGRMCHYRNVEMFATQLHRKPRYMFQGHSRHPSSTASLKPRIVFDSVNELTLRANQWCTTETVWLSQCRMSRNYPDMSGTVFAIRQSHIQCMSTMLTSHPSCTASLNEKSNDSHAQVAIHN